MANGSGSSAAGSTPVWAQWFVPSMADVLFVALLALLTCTNLAVRLLGDAGIGWHIRTGQLILATHAAPRVDPFSASMNGQAWFAWEWLYDVLAGWLESISGLNGVVLFTALIIAAVFSWTFRLLVRRGTNILLALALVLVAASASMIHFQARPHVVSWLFTVAWFWVLESPENEGKSRVWLLPPLMLVWVNVHGGFLLGFVLLAIYWLGAAWRWMRLKEDRFEDALEKIRAGRRIRELTWVGTLSAAATLVNPYGYNLHLHVYHYLSNRFLMDHIDEFQSPNFHYVAQKCFAVLLLLTLVALTAKRGELSASQGLVALFAVYSGLYASRNIPVSSLLLVLVIGPWLSEAMGKLSERRAVRRGGMRWPGMDSAEFLGRMKAIELRLRGHLWPVAAVVFTCWIAAQGGSLGSAQWMDAHFDGKRFPEGAVNYLEQHDGKGPILSLDSWGGYLIYRLYPKTKVVVDDRHDFYGEGFLKSYLKMVHVETGWEDFLRQHQAECVILPKDSALANILVENAGWRMVYGDDVAVVFEGRLQ